MGYYFYVLSMNMYQVVEASAPICRPHLPQKMPINVGALAIHPYAPPSMSFPRTPTFLAFLDLNHHSITTYHLHPPLANRQAKVIKTHIRYDPAAK